MVIGQATETNRRGFTKRLSDFCRPGDSGRKHKVGQYIHANLGVLELGVLVTGNGREAAEIAAALKWPMIRRHQPVANVPKAVMLKVAFG